MGKIINFFLIVIFFLGIGNFLQSQTETEKVLSIEVKLGFANTFHWNSPIAINTYFEGGRILEQSSNNELQYELSVHKHILKNQDLKIGIGLTNFSFTQEREDWTGILPNPYEIKQEELRYQFFSIILGHRFYFKYESKISLFWGNEIIFDKLLKTEYQTKGGVSYKSQIGIIYRFTHNISILTNVFGRSALMYYNKNKNYFPRMMGFEVGLNYEF